MKIVSRYDAYISRSSEFCADKQTDRQTIALPLAYIRARGNKPNSSQECRETGIRVAFDPPAEALKRHPCQFYSRTLLYQPRLRVGSEAACLLIYIRRTV